MKFSGLLLKFLLLSITVLLISACNSIKHVPENRQLLKYNVISVDDPDIKVSPIRNYLKQHSNTRTARIFSFHLWIYNISHDKSPKPKKLKKFLGIYKMGEIIGEPPVIVDTMLNDISVKQIKKYFRNKGYYRSEVVDSVLPYGKDNKKAFVFYDIKLGEAIKIDQINYNIVDSNIYNIVIADTSNSLIKPSRNLDVDLLQNERLRIEKLLKTKGYYKFSKEYIYYNVDTSRSNYTAQVDLKIINLNDSSIHHQYVLNNIYFYNGFDQQEFMKSKDQYYQLFDTTQYRGKFFMSRRKPFVKEKVLSNASYFKKGGLYSSTDVQSSFRHLSTLNEYKLINIRYNEIPDTFKIDVLVQLTPYSKYNYEAILEGTNSSGNLGIGGRLSFEHKSLFRGAEILNVSVYGKLESQATFINANENVAFNSQEVGANISLHFPKFLLPFKAERFVKKNHPRTVLEFTMNAKKRPEYSRSIYGSSFGYYWVSQKFFRHQFDIANVSAVKVFDIDQAYYNSIKNSYLEKSFDDYLISATKYTLFFSNKKERKKKNYFTMILNAEIAGNTLNAISTLSKLRPVEGSYEILKNKYAQYWRCELDFRFSFPLKRKSDQLIYRVYSGLAQPYGNITAMPYVKQFSSGGANGLRAWPVRSLGPGSSFNKERIYYNEAADFKFESNLEYRYKLFWVMEGALFIDVGNIWATNAKDPRDGALFKFDSFYKEIAIGTGLGIRFDFSYFILRLDYGIRVRDPKEIESERWLFLKEKYNPFGADYSMFNFGIDYPF